MTDIPRRSLAAGAGLLVGAMALRTEAQQKKEEAQQLASANTPSLRVQPLTFNPERIPGLSAKLLTSHQVKLDFANTPPFQLNGLKREEHIAYNSSILHELYFASLGEMPTRPSGLFAEALARDFGSLDRWQAEFGATAKALGGGSGWVILAYSSRDKRLYNHWAADHAMAPAGSAPLLTIDMYEHAYAMDYGANAGAYVDAFLKIVKWPNAERLYREAMRV